jgi:hypothetical protein
MPVGARYVGRPGPFGNPFRVGETTPEDWHEPFAGVYVRDQQHAVDLLESYLEWRAEKPFGWSSMLGPHYPWESQIREVLRGCDLACWCSLSSPCHRTTLLRIANEEEA